MITTERNSEKNGMMGGLVLKLVTAVPVVPAAELLICQSSSWYRLLIGQCGTRS